MSDDDELFAILREWLGADDEDAPITRFAPEIVEGEEVARST